MAQLLVRSVQVPVAVGAPQPEPTAIEPNSGQAGGGDGAQAGAVEPPAGQEDQA